MKQLLRFELKKIFVRKVNLIAIAVGVLLVIISDIALIHGESLYLDDGNSLKGVNAIYSE